MDRGRAGETQRGNDGSIDGQRYFNCSPGYGVFAPVRMVAFFNKEEEGGRGG